MKRTGPGFTEPIQGPTKPSSKYTEIQFAYVDKLTGNESLGYHSLEAVKKAIKRADKQDKESGAYEPDSYYIIRRETMKGKERSERYWEG